MRKIVLLSLLLLFQGSFLYAMKDCSDLEEQYDAVKAEVRESMDIWENMPSASSQKALLGKSLSDLL